MSELEENNQSRNAILQGILTFCILFIALIVTIALYDFSNTNINILAFILAVVGVIMISKEVYNHTIEREHIKIMAERMAEKLVRSSEKLFSEVYNNSPVAYLIVGKDGNIISANTASARLFGHSTETLVNRDFFAFIDTGSREHESVLKQKFQNGIVIADEEVKITRGEDFSWTTVSIFQFSNNEGKKLSLVTCVDITKQKEVDTAKTEFVSLASHQLRTPISGMRWSAELLLMDGGESLSATQKKYVDRLLGSIQLMNKLVDEFLQVSRFELGTRVTKQETVVLKELFEDIVDEQTSSALKKNLQIDKSYDNSILQIDTDLGLLRMIVTNLYTNAIKYSRKEGAIVLSYRNRGGELEIEVKDSGMGIPVTEQSRIFSKIFRASNAVKEVPDGTGLGLYIAQKAVQTLRGRISFLSAEGVGTTFTVVIPTSSY